MQEVSEAWKEAHKQTLLPETFVEITLSIVDDDAASSATQATGTNMDSKSLPLRVINVPYVKNYSLVAHLEHNYWCLDGSIDVVPRDGWRAVGFMSVDENPCSLTVSFSTIRDFNTPGFTIVWDDLTDGYATDFTVTAKNGENIIASTTITKNTSAVSVVEMPCTGYDKIVIEVTEWSLPQRRIYINELTIGHRLIFDKDNILSYTHEQTGDPLSFETSTNKIEFVLDNTKTKWDMLNPDVYEKAFFNQQKILVNYGMRIGTIIEWIKGGTFYLSEWGVSPDGFTAFFTAENVFCLMRDREYERLALTAAAKYDTHVYDALDYVNSNKYEIKAGDMCAITDVINAKFGGQYNVMGRVKFNNLDEAWVMLGDFTIYDAMTISGIVGEAIRRLSRFDEIYPITNFSSTMNSVEAPYFVESTSVPELLQKCANVCSLGLWQNRKGELLMKSVDATLADYEIPLFLAYSHPKIELTKPLKEVVVNMKSPYSNGDNYVITQEVEGVGETVTVENPYFAGHSSAGMGTQARTLCQKYAESWKSRKIISGEFRADPRLDLFDVITVETKYGDISPTMITNIKYTYDGAFKGAYTGRVLDLS